MSSTFDSRFNRDDIETLIEAMGDWEMVGNHDFHLLTMIKNAPMPPEDHEAYDVMNQIKDVFRSREKDILASRALRQEKSIFLKAKLLMVRGEVGIDKLFDMAEQCDTSAPPKIAAPKPTSDAAKKLELAEFFIKDLGVWDHFQKFLQDNQKPTLS
jgi:hypothetical protein